MNEKTIARAECVDGWEINVVIGGLYVIFIFRDVSSVVRVITVHGRKSRQVERCSAGRKLPRDRRGRRYRARESIDERQLRLTKALIIRRWRDDNALRIRGRYLLADFFEVSRAVINALYSITVRFFLFRFATRSTCLNPIFIRRSTDVRK